VVLLSFAVWLHGGMVRSDSALVAADIDESCFIGEALMQRSARLAVALLTLYVLSLPFAVAQSAMLTLPDTSQAAHVAQRIGITDIAIDYHRPLVHGRKIFGALQPYGKVWRAGANVNTTIAFTDPVAIEGHPLLKGVYGLHMIPGETSWTIIFSKNSTSWGSFTYDPAEDALRITVKPQSINNQEALTYELVDPQADSVVVSMRWEKTGVSFRVNVNTPEIVAESLQKQLRGRVQFEWEPWYEAANYLLDNKLNTDEALRYAESSIQNEDRFENEMTKARALTLLTRNQEAAGAEQKAFEIGTQIQVHAYGRQLQREGKQDKALEVFRRNITKDPKSWIAHNESARLAVAHGDFDTAIKEMTLAENTSSGSLKTQHADLLTLLHNKIDINK
jgi:tetratricopeptide (TPR) repeat protein